MRINTTYLDIAMNTRPARRAYFSTRKVGGIRFFALGRVRLSFCVSGR